LLRAADAVPRPGGYVGSQACASCHEEIFEQYFKTPMGQSLAALDEAAPLEDFDDAEVTPPGNRVYRVTREGDRVLHSEITLGANGLPLLEAAEEVRFALGSGKRGRSYLIHKDGRLFQSPIGWYAHSGDWDLSPGYAPEAHPRFSRRIADGCLYCHAGRMQPWEENAHRAPGKSNDRYEEPIFAEAAIGCERCHGPGERHVELHSGGDATDLADPIVNPARLPPDRRESVCNQCHLLGQSVIPRCGRGFFDFRPGDALEDVFVVLSAPGESQESGAMRAVSQVDQMRASRCYQASGGALGCVSCHDPHTTPAPELRAEFYRRRCNACHDPESCKVELAVREQPPAKNSCIHCHMPTEQTRDVPHTALTDHRILRRDATADPPSSDTSHGPETLSQQLAGWTVFDNAEERLPRAEVDRAKGIALMTRAWAQKDRELAGRAQNHLLKVLGPLANEGRAGLAHVDDAPLLDELATGYLLLENTPAAEECWKRLLEIDPQDVTALMGLAKAAEERADRQAYRAYVERLSAISPNADEVMSMRVKLRHYDGDRAGAAQEAERALKNNPTLVELRRWLVDLYRRLGQDEKAIRHQQLLDQLPEAQPGPNR
jgi:hypothetical protein